MIHTAILDTSAFFNLTPADLIGPSRLWYICTARHVACLILRDRDRHSFTQIGRMVGGRDHTTILSSVQKARELIATDEKIGKFARSQLILPRVRLEFEPIEPIHLPPPRMPKLPKHKMKNERCAEDTDAMNRYRGTVALGIALAKAIAERELLRGACAPS